MLELTFTLNGEAGEDTKPQAIGVVAALVALYGTDILPYPTPLGIEPVSPYVATIEEAIHAMASMGEPDAASIMSDAPTPPAPGTEPDRDVHGIPWDPRIHSDRGGSTGGKNQDGSWKRKRNTPDDVYANVMAELKAANTTRTVEAAVAGGVVPLPPGSAGTTVASVPSPPVAAPPASSTVPAPPPAGGSITFPDLMRKVTDAQKSETFTMADRTKILDSLGIKSVTDMIGKPDLLETFNAAFDAIVGG